MKLLDKLRAQPAWQSDDASVRLDAIRNLPDDDAADEVLLEVASRDADPRVRRAAIERMHDLAGLVSLVQNPDLDAETRRAAAEGVRDVVVRSTEVGEVGGALEALSDERDLGAIAGDAETESVGLAALERITGDKALGAVARKARHAAVALEAARRMTDRAELLSVALKADDKTTALAAYDRFAGEHGPTPDELEEISRRARQKAVARRAREALEATTPPRGPAPAAMVDPATAPAGLCASLERLVSSMSTLEGGRQALDAAVEAWSGLEVEIDAALADRFAMARRAVEDRLLELDAASVEQQRVTERRSAVESERMALCERVERLSGAEVPDRLAGLRAEWDALTPPASADPDESAALATLAVRFEKALADCEQRHATFLDAQAGLQGLETLVADLEQLLAGDDPEVVRKRWPGLDKRWRRAEATLVEQLAAEAETALAGLRERKRNVDERHRVIDAAGREAREKAARQNLTRIQKLIENLEAARQQESLPLATAERRLRQSREALGAMPALPTRRDREEVTTRLRDGVTALAGRVRELRDFADWQRWANLGIQEELCRQMEALAAPPDDGAALSDADVARKFRDLMSQWREAADAPREKGQALWLRFKTAHDLVYPRCEAYFAAQTVEREKSRERRREMVEEAERLRESTDWIKTAERITALQAEWKALGPAPRKDQRELWDRFRAACGTFFARRKADLAERKQVWAANLAQKEALCTQVEALGGTDDQAAAMAEVKRLQADWKRIGPVRRSKSDAIWKRFRSACDQIFDRAREDERRAAADRIAVREALCAELESLLPAPPAPKSDAVVKPHVPPAAPAAAAETPAAASSDTEAAAVPEAPTQAAASGDPPGTAPVAPAAETPAADEAAPAAETEAPDEATPAAEAPAPDEAVPAAATEAPDEATPATPAAAATEAASDVAPETAGGVDAEAPSMSPAVLADRVRDIQARWRQAPDVPPESRRQLAMRFGQVLARLVEAHPDQFRGTDLDPARTLKRFQRLCERAEALAAGGGEATDAGASPAQILAKKWRDRLASNTMGMGVDDATKRRNTLEEVKRLQAERRRLGPLVGADADALRARFQQACDRAVRQHTRAV